jgi:hypothetical protein
VKYRCPACGFHIFNRRVAKCESCGVALPAHLLFSAEDIAKLDLQHEQSQKQHEAKQRKRQEYGDSSIADSSGWAGDSSGDGGGGCD